MISGVSGGAVTVEVNGVTPPWGPARAAPSPPGTTSWLHAAGRYGRVQHRQGRKWDSAQVARAGRQGSPVSDIASATASVKPSNRCSGGTAGDVIETYVAGNQSALQNLGNGYYQLDWRTTKSWSNSCKELVFSLDGATVLEANPAFQFK